MQHVKTLVSLSLLFVGSAGGALAQTPATADATLGKRLFVQYGCYQCHGYEGQGGAAGARLVPRRVPAIALIAYVRNPAGNMPPYTAAVVSDTELEAIDAYLQQVPPPKPVKDIPLLK